jgi:hypothetical protein
MENLGKALIVLGVAIAAVGALLLMAPRVPILGRLPGDILVHRKNFTFYFPLATSLIVSAVASLILWVWSRR